MRVGSATLPNNQENTTSRKMHEVAKVQGGDALACIDRTSHEGSVARLHENRYLTDDFQARGDCQFTPNRRELATAGRGTVSSAQQSAGAPDPCPVELAAKRYSASDRGRTYVRISATEDRSYSTLPVWIQVLRVAFLR